MIKINEILKYLNGIQIKYEYQGNDVFIIDNAKSIYDLEDNSISWCSEKNYKFLDDVNKECVILCKNKKTDNEKISFLITDKPRMVMMLILEKFFFHTKSNKVDIEVSKSVKIGKNVNVGRGTIIEDNVVIGDNTYIGYNNVILNGTKIGDNCIIGSNNTIGADGFGYEKVNGLYKKIPHISNVIIKNKVEIGNNTTIDKGVLNPTIISDNVKIDNLVHIAHGVEIGKNSLIIANSMIAGSVKIGENTWIAPSTSIINQSKVGINSMTGIGTVVIKNIEDNELHVGVPSKKIKNI